MLQFSKRVQKGTATCLLPIIVCICLLLCQCGAALMPREEEKPEILYVRGCRDGEVDARETTGCFADHSQTSSNATKGSTTPIPSIQLTLQGVHLPAQTRDTDNGDSHAILHRVLLQEYRRPPLLAGEGMADMHPTERIVLTCENPTASSVFPTQLISCDLVNPLFSLAGNALQATQLARLTGKSIWFDVHLEERRATEGGTYRTLSILRRAVELRVVDTTKGDNEGAAKKGPAAQRGRGMSWEELMRHPLERLYEPSTALHGLSKAPRNATDEDQQARRRGSTDTNGEDVWVQLGIGGLQTELRTLFRRVFLSRLPSLSPLVGALQLPHVRGVILYGPPGNGKTLIARHLFRLLGPHTRLTEVNAADILSKYVGESEKNLRDVFEGYDIGGRVSKEETGAMEDELPERATGNPDDAQDKILQVLVIDEFEALFRRRGHSNDETSAKAVYDGVTNMLLSLMDGMESREDLLVVGLTNRLGAIDSALLRPGRFEVLIEVPPPDIPGREEIFFIHTEKLREQDFLASDVDLRELALMSNSFSGSDIAGTVRAAVSYALLRFRETGIFGNGSQNAAKTTVSSQDELLGHRTIDVDGVVPNREELSNSSCGGDRALGAFCVTLADFERAMQDIRSAKDDTSAASQLSVEDAGALAEVVDYDGTVSKNIKRANAVVKRVLQSDRTVSGLIAISGAAGTGKSTVARALAHQHTFTTVRYLSCRRLVELPNLEDQLTELRDAFIEASHAERGLVILDDYDVLTDAMGTSGYAANMVRGLLYDYMHRPDGVGRAKAAGVARGFPEETGSAGGSGHSLAEPEQRAKATRSHRILVLTSSVPSTLHQLTFDVHVRVHPVLRRGTAALLKEYRAVHPEHTAKVAALYPISMSYRTFLRITDMALQDCAQGNSGRAAATAKATSAVEGHAERGRAAGPFELPAYFSMTAKGRAAYLAAIEQQNAANFFAVRDKASVTEFSLAVRRTVANMGLVDPYQGWDGSDYDGEDGANTRGDQTGAGLLDEQPDIDEMVGAGDELLW